MNRLLIQKIDVWSVARTVFPLLWIVSAVSFFVFFLFTGGIVARLMNEISAETISLSAATVVAAVFMSIFLGFFSTVAATLSSVLLAGAYNFLAALGGGIKVNIGDSAEEQPEEKETSA